MKKEKGFGVFNDTVSAKYCIVVLEKLNNYRFVTEVCMSPKTFKYEWGEQAWFTESREHAEDLATAMNINGYSTFVMAVPSVFRLEDFRNKVKRTRKAKNETD